MWESLAYQIARGLARGWADGIFAALREQNVAVDESATPEDRARTARAAAAVRERVLRDADKPGSNSSAPSGGNHNG